MTNQASVSALLDLIRDRNSFVITSHMRPDGDAIGSSLGLMHLLEAMGKRASVVFTDPIPPNFHCLPGVDRISPRFTTADAIFFLECDEIERCSMDRDEYEAARPPFSINIDHHRSGRAFADFNWIDPHASAVGAMIYDLAMAAGVTISTDMADCLYGSILTDTGSFNYSSTSAATFAMAERLVRCGTSPSRIARAIYFCNPAGKVRLLGIALSNLQIEGEVCWSSVTLAEMARAGATVEDCEGVSNHLISILGVEAAVFLRELPGHAEFRLSLRSRGKVDVSRAAEHFGGGGHHNASGCTMKGTLAEVTERVVDHLRGVCDRLHSECSDASREPSTLLA